MIKQSLCPSCSNATDKLPTTSAKPPVLASGEISEDITPILIKCIQNPCARFHSSPQYCGPVDISLILSIEDASCDYTSPFWRLIKFRAKIDAVLSTILASDCFFCSFVHGTNMEDSVS